MVIKIETCGGIATTRLSKLLNVQIDILSEIANNTPGSQTFN